MIIIKVDEVKGYKTKQPYTRELKCLVSPLLQEEVKYIGMGIAIIPPLCKSSSHTHEREEETWYILSGRGRVRIGGEEREVSSHTVIVILPGMNHQIINIGNETLKVLWVYTPPGPENEVIRKTHI